MTNPIPAPPLAPPNPRALLIQQQAVPQPELPLPLFLQSPYLVVLWVLVLSTVVAALALGRMRVPRIARGVVVIASTATDSLTPLLLLPPSARAFVEPGQLAVVDTGGIHAATFTIASVEPAPLDSASARRRFAPPAALAAGLGGPKLVVRLDPCRDGHCLPLADGSRYAATAALGTRSLASFALPHS